MEKDEKYELLAAVKKRVEDKRRKVIRYNVLMIAFFVMMIAGLVGAVYYYQRLRGLTTSLQTTTTELRYAKDSIQGVKDSIQAVKVMLAHQKAYNDSLLVELYEARELSSGQTTLPATNNTVKKVVTQITASRDTAREYARIGYHKLKDKDLKGACLAFDKSEKSYNGYRDSYEVWFLLWKNRNQLEEPGVQKQLLEKIYTSYNSLRILTREDIQ